MGQLLPAARTQKGMGQRRRSRQIQRYMGYVQTRCSNPDSVEGGGGGLFAQEDDLRIKRALSMTGNIRFMKCWVEFHLDEAD